MRRWGKCRARNSCLFTGGDWKSHALDPLHRGLFLGCFLLLVAHCTFGASPDQTGSIIQVAFWNIRDLSVASRDQTELRQIGQVMHSNDCVAISELNDKEVLKKLCTELEAQGGKWKRLQSSKKRGNTSHTAEFYGFVYRSDKVWKRSGVRLLPDLTFDIPGVTNGCHFDREPVWCKFATLDGRLDFTLIPVHITFNKKEQIQKAEVRFLTNYFARAQKAVSKDKDLMLMGDFNENVGAQDSLGALIAGIPGLIDTTDPTPPTKVDSANTYDHILFQPVRLTEYTGAHGVTRFDETMFAGDKAAAKKACSDHRPVWVRLKVPAQDDD